MAGRRRLGHGGAALGGLLPYGRRGRGAVDRALAAGLTPEDLGELAREVARETAFGVLHALADPADGSLPAEVEERLPGWRLAELDPAGEPTGRHLDALHEDFAALEPKGPTLA